MARSPQDSTNGDTHVVEHDGKLWKPRPGATVTFEEFLRTRVRFLEVDDHVSWNPWDCHLRDEAEQAALAVSGQWIRAEPGFRQLTEAELQARMAQWDAEFEAEQHRKEVERQQRASRYDPEREKARLHLLEDEAILRHMHQEAAEMDGGSRYPRMPDQRRANMLSELHEEMEKCQRRVDRLRTQVGDPDTVTDRNGWLPAERRQTAVGHFSAWRIAEVTELRGCIDRVAEELKNTSGRSERAAVSKKSWLDEYKLKGLLAVTRPSAEEMCSECYRPTSWDRWRTGGDGLFYTGPCPAWPGWAERIAKTREMLLRGSSTAPTKLAAPKPQPLAVIPSGLPITEVIERLAQLQVQFPDGQVKRGRANRWEIWPSEHSPD